MYFVRGLPTALERMRSRSEAHRFFNRVHLSQGAQLLGTVFSMLGVIFTGLDRLKFGSISLSSLAWLGIGLFLCAIATVVSHRVRSGIMPLLSGCAMGGAFLSIIWVLARTGG
jgi:hypothetical protein